MNALGYRLIHVQKFDDLSRLFVFNAEEQSCRRARTEQCHLAAQFPGENMRVVACYQQLATRDFRC